MSSGAAPMLHHRVEGEGAPVVLLNGLMMTEAAWDPVGTLLAERFRVVRCDFLGQLMTPGTPHAEFAGNAGDVTRLLDHLEIERAHLVGASFGAAVALLVASRHPDRAASLVAITGARSVDRRLIALQDEWAAACRRALDTGARQAFFELVFSSVYSPEYLKKSADEMATRAERLVALPDGWFRSVLGLMDALRAHPGAFETEKVRCPALVVAAADDGIIRPERCRELAASLSDAVYEEVPGAGHGLVAEKPEVVAQLCLRFLERVA